MPPRVARSVGEALTQGLRRQVLAARSVSLPASGALLDPGRDALERHGRERFLECDVFRKRARPTGLEQVVQAGQLAHGEVLVPAVLERGLDAGQVLARRDLEIARTIQS